jgi:hypothetical protein
MGTNVIVIYSASEIALYYSLGFDSSVGKLDIKQLNEDSVNIHGDSPHTGPVHFTARGF